MPLPWSALSLVLKQTPVVLAAASAVVEAARHRRNAPKAVGEAEALRQRMAALEQQLQANAELSKQLAEHASAVAVATQATAAKTRQAFILAMVGVTLAVAALLVAWLGWS